MRKVEKLFRPGYVKTLPICDRERFILLIRQLAGANSLSNTRLIEKNFKGVVNGEAIEENRTIIVVNKLLSTPKQFPRKFAQIKKTPL